VVRIASTPPRTISIPPQVITRLTPQQPQSANAYVFGSGTPERTLDDLAADLLYAAHDANIEQPATVTPAALRHTYIAFLARQGIRLSDLSKLVGRLPTAEAAEYSSYAPQGKRVTLDDVVRVIDGVQRTDAGP
jgi:integrase